MPKIQFLEFRFEILASVVSLITLRVKFWIFVMLFVELFDWLFIDLMIVSFIKLFDTDVLLFGDEKVLENFVKSWLTAVTFDC